jgi:NADH dehydrogenase
MLSRHVVVIGGGFGGLAATRSLARAPVRVTVLDRSNHHVFQPLLYQVAMAGLSPAQIAVPIRSALRSQKNARVLLAEVTGVDFRARRVECRQCPPFTYDFLVLAPGATNSYFGHDAWAPFAPGLKDVDDAIEIRHRVLLAFEAAERETDPRAQARHLSFVVIGGGPTGVELAGAIAELAAYVLAKDFRAINPDATRVILLEGANRLLTALDPELSRRAERSLSAMGVQVRTGTQVTAVDERGVLAGDERIEASTVLWAAGVRGSPLAALIGLEVDRQGRVRVAEDCSVPGHPEVFCIGDAANFTPSGTELPLPGVSPVAMQQGRFAARQIERSIEGLARERFRYVDKGTMATIGRSRAVAQVGSLRLSGFVAWLVWLGVHIFYLIDFKNRLSVLLDWAWSYFTYQRGSRLITGHRLDAGFPPASAGVELPEGERPVIERRSAAPSAESSK